MVHKRIAVCWVPPHQAEACRESVSFAVTLFLFLCFTWEGKDKKNLRVASLWKGFERARAAALAEQLGRAVCCGADQLSWCFLIYSSETTGI